MTKRLEWIAFGAFVAALMGWLYWVDQANPPVQHYFRYETDTR